jgi:hypothetical protein
MTPSAISGISCSNSRWNELRARAGLRTTFTRLPCGLTSKIDRPARASLGWCVSPGILLAPRQNSLDRAQRNDRRRPFVPRHDAVDHCADLLAVFASSESRSGLADFLDDDLLGGLGSYPPADFRLIHHGPR